MTVSKAMIGYVSPYTVTEGDTTGDISDEAYTYYSAVAKRKLDNDNPGLTTTEYDHCHALLIVHLYVAKGGNLDLTSESLGGVRSISKREGITSQLLQYDEVIRDAKNKSNADALQTDVLERCDRTMGDLELDRQPIPKYDGMSTEDSLTDYYYDD